MSNEFDNLDIEPKWEEQDKKKSDDKKKYKKSKYRNPPVCGWMLIDGVWYIIS